MFTIVNHVHFLVAGKMRSAEVCLVVVLAIVLIEVDLSSLRIPLLDVRQTLSTPPLRGTVRTDSENRNGSLPTNP